MRALGVGLTVAACFVAGPAVGGEGMAEAITAFGLVGTWSVDCRKEPMQGCDANACGSRTTYTVPPSGPPTIRNIIGTREEGQAIVFLTTIHSAERIADDKIRIVSTQDTPSGTTVSWWRQPGEVWETVLFKVGEKFRTFSAHRADGKKISAEHGFEVRPPPPPPPATMYDALPTRWDRMQKGTPLFEKCSD